MVNNTYFPDFGKFHCSQNLFHWMFCDKQQLSYLFAFTQNILYKLQIPSLSFSLQIRERSNAGYKLATSTKSNCTKSILSLKYETSTSYTLSLSFNFSSVFPSFNNQRLKYRNKELWRKMGSFDCEPKRVEIDLDYLSVKECTK